MSPARPFDRFMVSSQVTRSRKMRAHFSPAERWAWVAVLCIASDAHIRGCFTIDQEPCTAKHLKDEADVSTATAASALGKFRKLEMLVFSAELDCERVRDWADYNPEPKADPTGADRQKRFRERHATRDESNDGVTVIGTRSSALHRYVTPPEVGRTKKEEQQPSSEPNPVLGAVVAGRASITNNIEAIA